MRASEEPVVVEQTFRATADQVWKSITDPDLMRQWFFDNIPRFEPEVGFETTFTVVNEGREFPHRWKVTEVVPSKKIAYDWSYDNYAGDSWVEWELFEEGSATRLRLTHKVREDFPDDVPEFQRESCVAGWTYFVAQSLKSHLEGAPRQSS